MSKSGEGGGEGEERGGKGVEGRGWRREGRGGEGRREEAMYVNPTSLTTRLLFGVGVWLHETTSPPADL